MRWFPDLVAWLACRAIIGLARRALGERPGPPAVGPGCYGSHPFLTVLLDKAVPELDPGLVEAPPPPEPLVVSTESSLSFFRGLIHGTLICLCFWVPLVVAGVFLLT